MEMYGLERIRVLTSYFLTLAVILSVIDTLLVIFWGGLAIQWGWLNVRSATIEFPIVSFLCTFLLLLIVNGRQKETVLLCGSLLVSGLIGEGLLRIVDHPFSKPYVDYEAWYQPSEYLGHELVPGFEGRGPMNLPIKVNGLGFRDDEHPLDKPAGTMRVLGLGDSFLMGWGVNADDIFLKQFESLLQQGRVKPVESINTGVPGWGLNQYYLFLKQTGLKYHPDLIVLAYFLDDLAGPIQERIPPNHQYQGGLRYKGGIFHQSRLFNFTKFLADSIRQKNRATRIGYLHDLDVRRADWARRPNYLMTESADENAVRYENILKEYMIRLRQLSEDSKAPLVMLFIPDISQLHHPDVQHINRILAKLSAEQLIPFADMTPIFEQSPDPNSYYLWPDDPHTNARGHAEMAHVLLDLVCHSPLGSTFC